MSNTTIPIPLTSFILLNATKIASVKDEISKESFVSNFANTFNGTADNATAINDQFKAKMFAEWIRNSPTFSSYRRKYKSLQQNNNSRPSNTKPADDKVIPFAAETINNLLSNSIETVAQQNGPDKQVIVPEVLRRALFDGWQKNWKVPLVLGDFAKSMDLSLAFTMPNGTRVILQPPEPPHKKRKEQVKGEFIYKKFGKENFTNF